MCLAWECANRRTLEILAPNTPAPASIRVGEVVATHDLSVLPRLVRREVRNKPTIAERGSIAVEYEHAAGVTGKRKQLACSAFSVEVAGERAPDSDTVAPTNGR